MFFTMDDKLVGKVIISVRLKNSFSKDFGTGTFKCLPLNGQWQNLDAYLEMVYLYLLHITEMSIMYVKTQNCYSLLK